MGQNQRLTTKQAWVVVTVVSTMFGQGMVLGFSTCLLTGLQDPRSDIVVTLDTSSWLMASLGIAAVFGYLLTSFIMDIFGRRTAYAVDLLPVIIGMLLTFFAADVTVLICGRLLCGMSFSAFGTIGAMVIGEYCSPQYRGMFLSMKTASLYLGSMVVHVLGSLLHWRTVALLCVFPYATALVITYSWSESPSWLAKKRRFSESEVTFYSLRGTNEASVLEIEELIESQRARIRTKKTFCLKIVAIARKFTKKNFLKSMLIFVFASILMESSGRHIFPAFASQIVTALTGDTNTFYYALAGDIILTVSAFVSSYLVKIMRMRVLLFSTGAASCVVLALTCSYLYLVSIELIPPTYTAVPLSLFAIYTVLANLACALLPLSFFGELIPLEHRAVGGTVAGCMKSTVLTVALKIMPFLLQNLKIYGAFTVLGLGTAISLSVLYFILPETRNRTLLEIEQYFSHGRFRDAWLMADKEHVNMKMINREMLIENKFSSTVSKDHPN